MRSFDSSLHRQYQTKFRPKKLSFINSPQFETNFFKDSDHLLSQITMIGCTFYIAVTNIKLHMMLNCVQIFLVYCDFVRLPNSLMIFDFFHPNDVFFFFIHWHRFLNTSFTRHRRRRRRRRPPPRAPPHCLRSSTRTRTTRCRRGGDGGPRG